MALRDDYKELLAWAREKSNRPVDMFKRAYELENACMEGIIQEKCNVKAEDGKDTFLELYPAIALSLQQFQYKLYREAEALAGMEETDNTLTIEISEALPED